MRNWSRLVLAVALVGLAAPEAPAQNKAPQTGQAAPAAAGTTTGMSKPAPHGAYVYIGWPNDGETIHSTRIKVWFGARNIGVAPAGVDRANTGHHHLLVDAPLPPLNEPIPNDKQHLHFGAGQTETTLELPPGTHTLQLIMGDENHIPFNPPVISKKITIHVAP